ncbi:hypothetical protein ACX9NE_04950 [Mycobacterium sp. ML4]
MKIPALAAAIAVFGLGICAVAPSAWAEDDHVMNGVYSYRDDDGGLGTWTVRTSCNPNCVAHVTTASGRTFEASLVNGRYVNVRTIPDGIDCPLIQIGDTLADPGNQAVEVRQWWDPVTLIGEVEFNYDSSPCHVGDYHDRFTLTEIG